MGLFTSLFGGGDAVDEARGMLREAESRNLSLVREATDRASAERARALGPLFREIQTLRAIRNFRDPLAARANLEAVRGQASGARAQAVRASGITGGPAASLSLADSNFIASALDAQESARIRRFESTTQLIAGLTSTAGQITTAGSNAEIAALAGVADRSIAAAAALGQSAIAAETERFGAIFGAFGAAAGGALGGYFGGE